MEDDSDQISGNSSIDTIQIQDEMKTSYLDYAMSVIVGRALPDVRDGLKPENEENLDAHDDVMGY